MLTPAIVEVSITTSGTFVVSNGFTFTIQLAVLFPSCVVTVITAVPPFTAVTNPFASTVATCGLLLLHTTFLFTAFFGVIVAVRLCVFPFTIVILLLFNVTPWTDSPTVTVQLADSFPSCVVAVIIAVPAFIAVINPLFTVTTLESLLLQVTALLGEFPRYYCCYYCFCISYF